MRGEDEGVQKFVDSWDELTESVRSELAVLPLPGAVASWRHGVRLGESASGSRSLAPVATDVSEQLGSYARIALPVAS